MRRCCLLLVCLLLLTGCGRADTQDVSSFAPAEGDRLVIFTSHNETIYEPILKEFEQRTGIWVELETGGTCLLYTSASHIAKPQYKNADGYWYGIYTGILGFMVNTDELERMGLEAPQDWPDLLKPEYKDVYKRQPAGSPWRSGRGACPRRRGRSPSSCARRA